LDFALKNDPPDRFLNRATSSAPPKRQAEWLAFFGEGRRDYA